MTNNFKMITVIIIGIILLFIFRMQNSDYNLNRTISACVIAQKQTSKSHKSIRTKFQKSHGVIKSTSKLT